MVQSTKRDLPEDETAASHDAKRTKIEPTSGDELDPPSAEVIAAFGEPKFATVTQDRYDCDECLTEQFGVKNQDWLRRRDIDDQYATLRKGPLSRFCFSKDATARGKWIYLGQSTQWKLEHPHSTLVDVAGPSDDQTATKETKIDATPGSVDDRFLAEVISRFGEPKSASVTREQYDSDEYLTKLFGIEGKEWSRRTELEDHFGMLRKGPWCLFRSSEAATDGGKLMFVGQTMRWIEQHKDAILVDVLLSEEPEEQSTRLSASARSKV